MASDKIHLLQVISGLDIGGRHGGAERFGIELSRRLDKDRFNVQVYAFWQRHTSIETYWLNMLKSEGIPVCFGSEWHGKFRVSEYWKGVRRLSNHCRAAGIDIIHSHFQMGTLASLYARRRKAVEKVIRTAHITLEWGEGLVAWLLRQTTTNWLFPLLLDQEVGVSEAVLQQLMEHPGTRFSKHAPILIHNAIFPDDFLPTSDPHSWDILIKEDDLVIGSVGRLTRQKGYETLIKAAPAILNAFPQAWFVLIGEGELRSRLEELTRSLGVHERFRFIGKVEDVRPYLRRMDLFVLPSLWEGLPTVILESMASGVPVIATDIPGTRELIQDGFNGWLVPVGDLKSLSDKLLQSLSEPILRETVAAAALSKIGQFSIDQMAQKYENLFHRLISK